MANVRRIVIGLKHFTSSTCGFGFADSVNVPEEEIDSEHIRIRRLVALFPGTKIELGPLVKDQPDVSKEAEPEKKQEVPPADDKPEPIPLEVTGRAHPDDEPVADAGEPDVVEPVVEAEGKLDNSADVDEIAKATAEDEAAKADVDLVEEPVFEKKAVDVVTTEPAPKPDKKKRRRGRKGKKS